MINNGSTSRLTVKGLVFTNVRKSQDKKNEKGKYYKVEEFLPNRLTEIRCKQCNMMWHNRKLVAERLKMQVQKGTLMVEGEPYCSQIVIPKHEQLIKLREEEIKELEEIKVVQGDPVTYESSTFYGFMSDASNYEDVNKAYEWVRFNNMDARHISCACILPGNNPAISSDYQDDDEHGAGMHLLQYMEEAKLENCTLFFARYYDGVHIGRQRFECMINAAKKAVNFKPYNRISR